MMFTKSERFSLRIFNTFGHILETITQIRARRTKTINFQNHIRLKVKFLALEIQKLHEKFPKPWCDISPPTQNSILFLILHLRWIGIWKNYAFGPLAPTPDRVADEKAIDFKRDLIEKWRFRNHVC